MTRGMDRYDAKQRRKVRRFNHIAKDLRTDKYRMRRVEDKRDREKYPVNYEELDDNE